MTKNMIFISTNHRYLRFPKNKVLKTFQLVYRNERKKLPILSIVFTNNKHIKSINEKFLNHNYETDVIAFPLGKDVDVEGEIYINLDAAREQARYYNVKYTEEVIRLLIHGALHLIGYSDKSEKMKKEMLNKGEKYLNLLKKKGI